MATPQCDTPLVYSKVGSLASFKLLAWVIASNSIKELKEFQALEYLPNRISKMPLTVLFG